MAHKFVVSQCTFEIPQDVVNVVFALCVLPSPLKVSAIKYMRERCGMGLYEAKHICDFIQQNAKQNSEGWVVMDEVRPIVQYSKS